MRNISYQLLSLCRAFQYFLDLFLYGFALALILYLISLGFAWTLYLL